MKLFSVDLSMRSTGCSYFENGELLDFLVVSSDKDDELLLIDNVFTILSWMDSKAGIPDVVRIEGLSFGSKSGSKDVIAGQFWYLRCELKKKFPDVRLEIVPVTSWRSPLFSKEENKALKEAKQLFAANKKSAKGLKGLARKEIMAKNKELEMSCSIKEATWIKLEDEIQDKILSYLRHNGFKPDAKYDICDSIWLGRFKGSAVKVKKEKKKK